jgi:hypothetical protein
MKLTLTPSLDQSNEDHPQRSVSGEMPHSDDQTIDQVIEQLIKPALLAWGFHETTIRLNIP